MGGLPTAFGGLSTRAKYHTNQYFLARCCSTAQCPKHQEPGKVRIRTFCTGPSSLFAGRKQSRASGPQNTADGSERLAPTMFGSELSGPGKLRIRTFGPGQSSSSCLHILARSPKFLAGGSGLLGPGDFGSELSGQGKVRIQTSGSRQVRIQTFGPDQSSDPNLPSRSKVGAALSGPSKARIRTSGPQNIADGCECLGPRQDRIRTPGPGQSSDPKFKIFPKVSGDQTSKSRCTQRQIGGLILRPLSSSQSWHEQRVSAVVPLGPRAPRDHRVKSRIQNLRFSVRHR